MAVHRISDKAETALRRIAKDEGRKPAEVLSQLIIDYEEGLKFNGR